MTMPPSDQTPPQPEPQPEPQPQAQAQPGPAQYPNQYPPSAPYGQQPVIVQTKPEGMGRVFGRTLLQAGIWSTAIVMAFLFVAFGFIVLLVGLIGAATADTSTEDSGYEVIYGDESAKRRILAIPIEGVIYTGPSNGSGGGLFGSAADVYAYDVKAQLLDAIDDDSIDGVVLIMDTPGGTGTGAQVIYDGVKEYREKSGKPITAFVAGMSASAGMYGMAPATRIFADHSTIIGSIGVRLGPFEYYDKLVAIDGPFFSGGVTTENGITVSEITAGRGKDEGSPFRQLTDEERANFQTLVDTSYASFVRAVSESRGIPEVTIREKLGALVYGEVQAKENKLIDEIAGREAAFDATAELAGLRTNNFKVVQEKSEDAGLLGLFARTQSGPQQSAAATPAAPSLSCFAKPELVMYYGNFAGMCAR